MEQSSSGRSARDRFDRWAPPAISLLAAFMVLARLWLVFRRLYDPDELQHLHAGYCVWRGLVPYRDFFEQHQPVLWYLALPLFDVWGASLKVLFAGRTIIWMIGALTVGLTWSLGNRLFGRYAGPIAALLLVTHAPYQEKNVEWRPDNLAVPLVLVAVFCLDRSLGTGEVRWTVLAGALFAASFFCTQKIVYAGFGIIGAYLWIVLRSRATDTSAAPSWAPGAAGRAVQLVALALGAGLVAASVAAFYWQQGALGSFIHLTLLAPLEWRTKEPIGRYVVNQLASGPVFWGAGVGGWVLIVSSFLGRPSRSMSAAMIAGGALTHTAGLLHVPAAFYQYYLPLSPLVAVLGAHALTVMVHSQDSPVHRSALSLAIVAGIAVVVTALGLRSLVTVPSPAWIAAIGGLLGVAGALYFFRFRRAGMLLALAASVLGEIPYLWIQFQWNHEHQTRRIQQLMAATEPDDAFLDGFTGYGSLRPHAFYWFWINHHSWPMIPVADRIGGVLNALQDSRTRVVLFDQNLARFLSDDAIRFLDENYVPDARYSDFPALVAYVDPTTTRRIVELFRNRDLPISFVYVRRGRPLPHADEH